MAVTSIYCLHRIIILSYCQSCHHWLFSGSASCYSAHHLAIPNTYLQRHQMSCRCADSTITNISLQIYQRDLTKHPHCQILGLTVLISWDCNVGFVAAAVDVLRKLTLCGSTGVAVAAIETTAGSPVVQELWSWPLPTKVRPWSSKTSSARWPQFRIQETWVWPLESPYQ